MISEQDVAGFLCEGPRNWDSEETHEKSEVDKAANVILCQSELPLQMVPPHFLALLSELVPAASKGVSGAVKKGTIGLLLVPVCHWVACMPYARALRRDEALTRAAS